MFLFSLDFWSLKSLQFSSWRILSRHEVSWGGLAWNYEHLSQKPSEETKLLQLTPSPQIPARSQGMLGSRQERGGGTELVGNGLPRAPRHSHSRSSEKVLGGPGPSPCHGNLLLDTRVPRSIWCDMENNLRKTSSEKCMPDDGMWEACRY